MYIIGEERPTARLEATENELVCERLEERVGGAL